MFARHVGTNIQHVMYVSAQLNRYEPAIECNYMAQKPESFLNYIEENQISMFKLWHRVIEPELIEPGVKTDSDYVGCLFYPTYPSLSPVQSISCCMDTTQATSLLPTDSSSYPQSAMAMLALLSYGISKVPNF